MYPALAGPTEQEIQALEDLSTLSKLNYTRFSTRDQTEYVQACLSVSSAEPAAHRDWARKIPSLLQSVLDIISRGTGAATYAFAAQDDMGDRTLITE